MKELIRFDDPFRPIYEMYSVGGWLVAAIGTLVGVSLMPYPAPPFLVFAAFALGMAIYRAVPGMRLAKIQGKLEGAELTFMTRQELKALTKDRPGELFLGFGFPWGQQQAQIVHTLRRYDPERFLPRAAGDMGANWIHGIGALQEEPVFIPIEHANTHTLICGTTGSGKTRLYDALIAQLIAMNFSVVILDPKGDKDMAEAARRGCEELGRPNDFVYFHPAHPEKSTRIDPLKNFSRGTELATRVAAILPSEGGDPFTAFSQMALNKLCEGLLLIHEKPSLMLFRRLLEGGIVRLVIKAMEAHFERVKPGRDESGAELAHGWILESKPYTNKAQGKGDDAHAQALIQYYRDHMIGNHPSSAVEGLISLFEHDSSHMSKMITGLMPVLNMLTSGGLGPLLSPDYDDPNDHRPITDLGKITRTGQVAYIGLDSLSDGMVASAIGSMLLSDMTAVAGERYNFHDPRALPKVALLVDEAAEVMNAPLIQMLNKGRGSGFYVFLAVQTLSDIADRLGSKDLALKTIGNINNLIALRCNDEGTQEYISTKFGTTVVRQVDVGFSAKNEVNDPLTYSATMSESLSETEAPLIPPDLIAAVPNLQHFATVSAGRTLKLRMPILKNEA